MAPQTLIKSDPHEFLKIFFYALSKNEGAITL